MDLEVKECDNLDLNMGEQKNKHRYLLDESKYERYFSIIESLLYVTGDPLELTTIAEILECTEEFARELMVALTNVYESNPARGLKVICINGGYQFGTKAMNSDHVQMLLKTNVRQSLSRAALETLSIVAYKQPITRVEIEEIRGVKSDRAVYTLVEKGLIKECGKKNVIGRPNLYSTTDEFLRHFEFSSLSELPSLESFIVEEEEETEEEA